jgi:hypothetical protein
MAVTNKSIKDGNELKFYSTNNVYSGGVSMSSNVLLLGGSSINIGIKSGNNLIFKGTSHIIGGTNSTLAIGNSGDTVNLNVSGVTYNFGTITGTDVTITGNLKVNGTFSMKDGLTSDTSGIIWNASIENTQLLIYAGNDEADSIKLDSSGVIYLDASHSSGNIAEFQLDAATRAKVDKDGYFYTGTTKVSYEGHTQPVSSLTWGGNVNFVTSATANGQEWSIDLTPGAYTGTYWQVWSTAKNTILRTDSDTGLVTIPYDATIGGKLTLNASEGLNVKGIRGTLTSAYVHMIDKVGIGNPGAFGSGETDTPTGGLSTYGGANLAVNNGNVGIGYNNPTEKLTVNGAISIMKKFKLQYNAVTESLDTVYG